MMRRLFVTLAFATGGAALLSAQVQFSDTVRAFIKVDAPVVALTNVRVIDGTGHARTARNQKSVYTALFPRALALERAFVRAGGTLIACTDPTGGGGVVPGYANQRQLELLVEAGFSPLEAISIGTANGAKYLGRAARAGTIAVGKQADLVVLNGDPSTNITDVRNVEIVFKQGVGFDPVKLIDSVRGQGGVVVAACRPPSTCGFRL